MGEVDRLKDLGKVPEAVNEHLGAKFLRQREKDGGGGIKEFPSLEVAKFGGNPIFSTGF